MAIFKCKVCGGTLEINVGETVATCEYCGTKQTLPKLDDEKKANLFDRANHFRRNNDFDKAMGIYEQILNEDTEDAESYWSIVLCRYGIEYVEDPSSRKRVPTVNRAQFTSVFDDEDYKSAIKYADSYQKNIYEAEAAAINEIQKGILAISQKEEPFDVFICYKETDNNGRRTQDSVLATELYHELTKEGFKVFFSRITLEDKLGIAYEPYIFAALHSSKVMVVLGTRPEYFNAVWVKNEWSRYLALIKNGAKKILIPAYRDMDPYDLPEEFSHLQAQDMSKLGFMQDLVRSIKKLVATDSSSGAQETVVVQSATSGNASALVKRGFLALEDEEWAKADEFFEQALNQNAEDAQAYLGKLLAELQVKKQEELIECKESFENMSNYQKAVRFADDRLKNELQEYINVINTKIKDKKTKEVYASAMQKMNTAKKKEDYISAQELFDKISHYKDSVELSEKCKMLADETEKESIYSQATKLMNSNDIESIEKAIKKFGFIPMWRDSEAKILECHRKIEESKINEEQKRIAKEKTVKKYKKIIAITTPIIIVIVFLLNSVLLPIIKYNKAVHLLKNENYKEAYHLFVKLNNYKDSVNKVKEIEIVTMGKSLDVGNTIAFGNYEQDNDSSNGKEEIKWRILDKKDGRILLLSEYALDCQRYDTAHTDLTWEMSSLRKWLNETFFNEAFSADERSNIVSSIIRNPEIPYYGVDKSNDTEDKVFLLSIDEVHKYFKTDDERQVEPTNYAKAHNAYVSDNGKTWWWLRTADYYSMYVIHNYFNGNRSMGEGGYGVGCDGKVNIDDGVDPDGDYEYTDYNAVRPALWIEIGD